ncbi:ABC transporter ATP-binding protein [soil metagenome]
MAGIQLDGVTKRYPDGTEAVKQMDLSIEDGEFMILVGPSGCGKSTALRMIAGLEDISEGDLSIGGETVNDLAPKDRNIAMVFQNYALYPHMTVRDNMGFALKLAKVDQAEIDKKVEAAAETLDLTQHLDRKPANLSGGQRQRVAMGRAIVRDPAAFLMDEPLSNLDAKLRVQMRAEIAQLQDRLGVTTLYVTHDQVEAMTMGDRVALLKRGELMQVDAPQTLYDRPDNLFVAGFIGSPAMNLVEGTMTDDGGLAVKVGSRSLRVSDATIDAYPKVRDYAGKSVAVGMRPEDFSRPDGSVPDDRKLSAKVSLVEALGSEILVHFETDAKTIVSEDLREAVDDEEAFAELEQRAAKGGATFTARFEPGAPPKLGQDIDVEFKTEKLHFFDLESGLALR